MQSMKHVKRWLLFLCLLAIVGGVAAGGWYMGTVATAQVKLSQSSPETEAQATPTPDSTGTDNPLLLGSLGNESRGENGSETTASPSPTKAPATSNLEFGKTTASDPIPVMMYHYIRVVSDSKKDPTGYGLSVTPEAFERQLSVIQRLGYKTVTMAEVAAGKAGGRSVALTFDDGYDDFYKNALPVLKKYRATATVYVITSKVGTPGYLSWSELEEIRDQGIEIGSHTVSHRELNTLSESDQRSELESSQETLASKLGVTVVSVAYPVGRYTGVTERLAQEAGYKSAVTTRSGTVEAGDSLFTLKRVRIKPTTDETSFQQLFIKR